MKKEERTRQERSCFNAPRLYPRTSRDGDLWTVPLTKSHRLAGGLICLIRFRSGDKSRIWAQFLYIFGERVIKSLLAMKEGDGIICCSLKSTQNSSDGRNTIIWNSFFCVELVFGTFETPFKSIRTYEWKLLFLRGHNVVFFFQIL